MAHPASTVGVKTQHRYLRVQDLLRLQHLAFTCQKRIEGQYVGHHASPQRGQSVEFNDYRKYIAGDEVTKIDWKVYGRSDKLFVKRFEHHNDLTVNLLVDASASMDYRGIHVGQELPEGASGGEDDSGLRPLATQSPKGPTAQDRQIVDHPSKFEQACFIAAAIAFLVTKQQDRIGFGIAQNGLHHFHRPQATSRHLNKLLGTMERVRPRHRANLAESLRALALRTSRKGLLVVISDLLEDVDDIMRALTLFKHRGNKVILFQILHADELHLPNLANAVFVDSETGQRLPLNVADVTPAYEEHLKTFLGGWTDTCRNRGIDHNLVSTATAYHDALQQYLTGRTDR